MPKQTNIETIRHSLSHIMALAIQELYPNVKFAIGPAIENGFYYDFDFNNEKIGLEDLKKIEKKINHIIKQNIPFKYSEIKIDEAIQLEKKNKQYYKVELIKDLKKDGEKKVSYYELGQFNDLCLGPHIESSGKIAKGSFKLTKLAGAYWRGNEKNKMLTRIYGVAFKTREELDKYSKMMEEAEKRNHIKMGKKLDLFSMHKEGPGFPFFHNNGMIIWNELVEYWREEHKKEGYLEIKTPIILDRKLWEESGHWDHYKENMYFTKIDDKNYAIKPMNCPGGILIYKTNPHSYRNLPLKVGEIGLVHRHELSGVLNGLLRVRAFHQDDAHIYCTEKQVKDEVTKIARLIDRVYKTFKFDYHIELSTRPEKSIGTDTMWKIAEKALKDALEQLKWDYKLNPGDGAFYGPKIDFHIKDAIGRTWQCGTIQLDFAMPERFNLTYLGPDGKKHRPVMLHRVIYGSLERFLGVYIEHCAGAFPLWLAPEQVWVITVGNRHKKYAKQIHKELLAGNIRSKLKDNDETISKKIREGEIKKIPYILVIGDKEEKKRAISIRKRTKGDQGIAKLNNFIEEIKTGIEKKQ